MVTRVKCNGTDCSYSCLGYRSCIAECPLDAIAIVDGIAQFDKDKCKGCKKCVRVCPRSVIDMVPYDQEVVVECNSKDFGKSVKEKCPTKAISARFEGKKVANISEDKCIGCTVCTSVCLVFAIEGNREELHSVNPDLCIGCSYCAKKCPVDAIEMQLK